MVLYVFGTKPRPNRKAICKDPESFPFNSLAFGATFGPICILIMWKQQQDFRLDWQTTLDLCQRCQSSIKDSSSMQSCIADHNQNALLFWIGHLGMTEEWFWKKGFGRNLMNHFLFPLDQQSLRPSSQCN